MDDPERTHARNHARTFRLANAAAQTPRPTAREGYMRRNRSKSHFLFQARITTEAEKLRRRLQRQYADSNGRLVERALRKLEAHPDDASEAAKSAA